MTREDALEKAIHYSKVYHSICVDAEGFWAAVIEALSQEPCTDAVSREEVKKIVDFYTEQYDGIFHVNESIDELPSVNPQPCDDAISRNQSNACSILDDECPYPHKHCWECPLNYQYMLAKHELDKNVELPSVNPQKSGKWIPVSEKLPKVGISVLVSDADSDIYFTHITRDSVFFDEWGNKIKGVIAWMPLPKPYEPQESEDNE